MPNNILLVGETLHNYYIEEPLGEPGSFGEAYRVRECNTGNLGALKVLKNPNDTDALKRFRQENGISRKLKHPQIIEVLTDVVEADPKKIYYVMELAHGNLDNHMRSSSVSSFLDKMDIFKSICESLHHAHQQRVVHRDLHWGNILTKDMNGVTSFKLNDFGLAKDFDLSSVLSSGQLRWGGLVKPPESQFEVFTTPSLEMSIIGDVYALGVILNFLFTGNPVSYILEIMRDVSVYTSYNSTFMKSEKDRMDDYISWLNNLDQNKLFPKTLLLKTDESKILNDLLSRLFNADYRKRYKDVGEVLAYLNQNI